jgi:amino acid permease
LKLNTKSIIGSGVVGLPFAFQQAGFGMTIVLLILVAILTGKIKLSS